MQCAPGSLTEPVYMKSFFVLWCTDLFLEYSRFTYRTLLHTKSFFVSRCTVFSRKLQVHLQNTFTQKASLFQGVLFSLESSRFTFRTLLYKKLLCFIIIVYCFLLSAPGWLTEPFYTKSLFHCILFSLKSSGFTHRTTLH